MTATTKIIGLPQALRAVVLNPMTRRKRATITLAIDIERGTIPIIGPRKVVSHAY